MTVTMCVHICALLMLVTPGLQQVGNWHDNSR
jgi:hypothetical protein